MDIPAWVKISFEVNVANVDVSLQETLIELQNDEVLCGIDIVIFLIFQSFTEGCPSAEVVFQGAVR